ncbi:tyrosine--tRNA ligase [Levilactobacillus brevis]|uniref:Tyrosine--tRNA ligase n=1 Tax=Levilactobacillus brevis TaxID=1580 RepID=A0A0D0GY58_LEVBR|nr:tyrosine--tRNA ligase [Levilactobacillus brevis]AJA80581.1 tyrosyl-tRNA synthase [Levilactobacillus brevis BSO 464]KIO94106.1 Tyrosyl-tRNA synthetase [Levilactobacillus brevis]OLF67497.1 tyrosine--tRNA ligase [Levilactobacillus brevis]PBQ24844.1 tyrosine--tRNA ligase [Levilactobacillus brevis]QCZ54276.1 tyrosyl-tRNA synthetase [Levilactobacillus brevis]
MNIIDELTWRGAINQQTDAEGLKRLTSEKKISLYCGVDPTGDSMHIGHLIPFMMMKRFELAGHHPYILIGGATGSIGDPSGRKTERQLQTMDKVQHNVKALSRQMQRLFGGDSNVTMVNNYDWLSKISLLDFLRDYGKLVNINTMLAKDIVASRLDTGISFTEFTYQILQSVDFLTLHNDHNIQLQIGGADQWGNITAGIDLIHKIKGADEAVYGLTIPLMLKADGTKFGKTAGGAIWLDADKTSPYEFYQFWLNQDDRDVIRYLKFFTFLGQDEINQLAATVEDEPEKRLAQRRLAEEVTRFVHGEEALESAQHISEILFSGDIQRLTLTEVQEAFEKVPNVSINSEPTNIVELLTETAIEPSRRQAREDITNGAITINGERCTDTDAQLNPKTNFSGKFMVIRRGKKNYFLAKVKD